VRSVEEGGQGDQAEAAQVEVRTVWTVGAVEVEKQNTRMHFESKTQFEELKEDEEEDDGYPPLIDGDTDEEDVCPPPPPPFQGAHEEGCNEGCCGGLRRVRRKGRRGYQKVDTPVHWFEGEGEKDEEKWIQPVESDKTGDKRCIGLTSQVADVKKPLVAVKRIIEKGNHVSFGPQPEDCYIMNKQSGDKMLLKSNGKGSFLMDVCFVGGERTSITVDSGAEENVCPWEWGHALFGMREADRWMTFRNASGGEMLHYGSRDVLVTSPF